MVKNLENDVREGKQISDIVPEECSVCHEVLDKARTVVKLQCNHQFHLDCIGSAYNAKNKMECPNCWNVEEGHWLYARGIGTPQTMLEITPLDNDNIAPVVNIAQGRQIDGALIPPRGPTLPMTFPRHMSREPPEWLPIHPPISFGSFPPDYFHNNETWLLSGGSNGGGSTSNGEGRNGSEDEGGASVNGDGGESG